MRICLHIDLIKDMENSSSLVAVPNEGNLLVHPIATSDYLAQLALTQIDSYNRTNRKTIPQKLIDTAISNQPFDEVLKCSFLEPNTDERISKGLSDLKAGFLTEHFMMFADNGIAFDTGLSEIEKFVESALNQDKTLTNHLDGLKKCFIGFQTVFSFIEFLQKCGKFGEKHMQALYSYTSSFSAIADVQRAAPMMVAINALLNFNRARYIYSMPMILSNSCLADILLAMPVWYLPQNQNLESSKLAQYFFDTVGSVQFITLLQLYNLNIHNRSIANFPANPDPIPASYLEFYTLNNSLFRTRLIATPYHNTASNEWQAPVWTNNIDPVGLGFFHSLPYFMITHQWSGDGILRHVHEMIGDTINHLSINRDMLAKIQPAHDWFNGKTVQHLGSNRQFLENFADELIKAFDEGRAISFLRGR